MAIDNLKANQDLIINEMNELLQQFSESLGIDSKIAFMDFRSSSTCVDLRIELSLIKNENGVATKVSKFEQDWERKCAKHSLNPDCLHKKIRLTLSRVGQEKEYEVLGIWSMRRQKSPVIIMDTQNSKLWKVTVNRINNC
jgi:hypothetical protein